MSAGFAARTDAIVLHNLSEIVVEDGLASAGEMRQAAELADQRGVPLVVALLELFDVDQLALVAALSRHTHTPIADPEATAPDPEAIRQLPHELCQRLAVVPLSISAPGPSQRLRVAVADPTDAVARAEIEHVCGCDVEAVLLPLDRIEALIHSGYRELVTEVMPRARARFGQPEPSRSSVTPTTRPHHRVADEASVEVRLEALVKLLQDRGVISEEDVSEAVRAVLKRRSGPS